MNEQDMRAFSDIFKRLPNMARALPVEEGGLPREYFHMLEGSCVVCGYAITEADYRDQNVVAIIGPDGAVLACATHLTEDGPDGPKYRAATEAMAKAKKALLDAYMELPTIRAGG